MTQSVWPHPVCEGCVEIERERIIKLLEEYWLPIADVEKCIALIKGNNK